MSQPYTLLTQQRCEQLRNALQQRCARWVAQWCTESFVARIEISAASEASVEPARAANTSAPELAQRCGESLWLLGTAELPATMLLGAYAGRCPDDATRKALQQAALADLLRSVFNGSATAMAEMELPEHCRRRGSSCVEIELHLGQTVLRMISSVATLNIALEPIAVSGLPTLTTRRQAAMECWAECTVTLDLGTFSLPELSGLTVGDTLITRTSIDDYFHLTAADGKALLSGYLGKQENQLALQVVAN